MGKRCMNTTHEDLTAAEEGYLKHTRAAKEQGVSLREYCEAAGLDVQTLYNGRRGLRKKGVLPRRRAGTAIEAPRQFVEVQVAAAPRPTTVCRLQHPTGWVIEC